MNTAANKRRYHSESRQAEADLTKKRILDAAKDLFSRQGFDQTTIGAIADHAGVSSPSVYALYKSKAGLLRALVHVTIFGEEYKSLVDKVITDPDPVKCLRTAASITRLICDAESAEMGFIRAASVLSPELKTLEREGELLRYKRQEVLVRRLFDAGVVKPEIEVAIARDILWSLTSRDMYRMMVIERKWSSDQFEVWLADILISALLKGELRS